MPSHIYNMDGPRDDIAKLTETNTIGFHSFVGFKGKKKKSKKKRPDSYTELVVARGEVRGKWGQ